MWFSRLEEVLNGMASRAMISKYLDKLFGYGIICGTWRMNAEGDWIKGIENLR